MKTSFRVISLLLLLSMLLTVAAGCSCTADTPVSTDASSTTGTPTTTEKPSDNESPLLHTCTMVWQSDASCHWQACSLPSCDEKGESALHVFQSGKTTADGKTLIYTETCSVCQYQKSEKGASEVILTFDDMVNAIYDGAITMAHHDTAFTSNKTHYFQNLFKKGENTITVKALEATTANFIVTSLSDGGRGTYSYIYKNLTVNGSADGVTYTKGSPTFSNRETPLDVTVATVSLQKGINKISFSMGASVSITGIKLTDLQAPVYVTADADYLPSATRPLSGEGSEASPWLIASAEDFIAMNAWIGLDESYAKGYYKMTADIDFSGTDFAGINASVGFSGSFDGNGHVVKNLKIERILKPNNGLFGKVLGGTVKNLGIESGSIEGGGAERRFLCGNAEPKPERGLYELVVRQRKNRPSFHF